ncbi:uncharacterized protein LOC126837030 [Adelges cooleyi]|uniref:uncharacterized protein LOC126837030 n=1 Tax=Adelges cooleyi TaxID=133065 RepID=UPI00218039E0|nr:uncharacterized protein LOC126837030 [Adelges cooleyi]
MQEPEVDWLMLVAIAVISGCIVLGIMFVICCFWSKCLLFDCCRPKYNNTFIISYDKPEEALNLPPEDVNNSTCYSPVRMKVTKTYDY